MISYYKLREQIKMQFDKPIVGLVGNQNLTEDLIEEIQMRLKNYWNHYKV